MPCTQTRDEGTHGTLEGDDDLPFRDCKDSGHSLADARVSPPSDSTCWRQRDVSRHPKDVAAQLGKRHVPFQHLAVARLPPTARNLQETT